jgi:coenzyme PQQ precursor peptide PqqA
LILCAGEAMLVWPALGRSRLGRNIVMAWKTPRIVEVSLALEINSYACAEIG